MGWERLEPPGCVAWQCSSRDRGTTGGRMRARGLGSLSLQPQQVRRSGRPYVGFVVR